MACLAPAMFLSFSSETASWHKAILTCRAANIVGTGTALQAGNAAGHVLQRPAAVHLFGWWRVHDLGGFCLHGGYVNCASLLQCGARLSGPAQGCGSSCGPAEWPRCSTRRLVLT